MNLAVCVLTGRRPGLLQRTLQTMQTNQPDVWYGATWTVVHNGGDQDTADVLDRYRWDSRVVTDELLPIGQASQLLIAQAVETGQPFTLRLEDDWYASDQPWFDESVGMIRQGAGQVRLRAASEKVASRCQACRQPLDWERRDGHLWSSHGHYTHNPSLIDTGLLAAIAPYQNERHAGSRFHQHQLPVVQHIPGVFAHLGDGGLSLKRNGGAR